MLVPCTGVKKDGSVCGVIATTGDPALCRHHRAGGRSNARVPLSAPVQALESIQDVAELASWAAIEVANGRMSQSSAHAIAATCREWRQSFAVSETQDAAARFIDLVEAMYGDRDIMEALVKSKDPAVLKARAALKSKE